MKRSISEQTLHMAKRANFFQEQLGALVETFGHDRINITTADGTLVRLWHNDGGEGWSIRAGQGIVKAITFDEVIDLLALARHHSLRVELLRRGQLSQQ